MLGTGILWPDFDSNVRTSWATRRNSYASTMYSKQLTSALPMISLQARRAPPTLRTWLQRPGCYYESKCRLPKSYLCKTDLIRKNSNTEGPFIPQVTIKTGIITADGHEEQITEYLCDWPECANIAILVLGYAKEIGACAAVCDQHTPKSRASTRCV